MIEINVFDVTGRLVLIKVKKQIISLDCFASVL
jgi:hypothetical protein